MILSYFIIIFKGQNYNKIRLLDMQMFWINNKKQKQAKDSINKLIIMPKADEQTTKDRLASPKKSLKPIPSRLIDFSPHSQTQSMQNQCPQRIQKNHFESHKLNKKINKMLRLSFMPFNKNDNQQKRISQKLDMSLYQRIQVNNKDARKQQIFSIPKIIKNINEKLSHYNQKDSSSHFNSPHKLFQEEQDFMHKLNIKAKFSTLKKSNDLMLPQNPQLQEGPSLLQESIIKQPENQIKKFQRTNLKEPVSYRSKTMQIQAENNAQKSFSYSYRKIVPGQVQQQSKKQQIKNINRYYEKFQSLSRFNQKDQTLHTSNQFVPTNHTSYIYSEKSSPRRNSAKNQRLKDINKQQKSGINQKRKNEQTRQMKDTIKNQFYPSHSPLHDSNLIGKSKTRLKVMIKSNSNNKGFIGENELSRQGRIPVRVQRQSSDLKKRIINLKPQERFSNQSMKLINFTSYQQNNHNLKQNNVNFSWRAERIHHPSTQKAQINRNESKKSAKKSRYLHFERNMKLSNNIHIVVTQSNKTKINIFHNSLLLKQDPQKIDALTSLIRDASKMGCGQTKIEVPTELEINKLKIEEKNNQFSGRESRKQIQTQLREGIRKNKQRRKESVPRTKTEKKYQIVLQDVKPWQIGDQRNLQISHYTLLNDNEFTYLNSKTII